MATEKIINTRIQLKYDTLTNWETSNPVLKAGEVAVIAIASGNTQTVNSVTAPQCLMKVGDGTSNFKALPYTSALAADVYSWAKKSEAEFITWVNKQVTHPAIPDGFTIAVNVTDDDVIIADLKGGKNSVSGSVSHAKKGPSTGFTGGATTGTADAYGESVTIKVPKITVDEYGHVNSASDITYTVAIPAAQDLSGYKTKQNTVSDPTASGKSLTFIDSISQNANGVITATKKNVNLDAYATNEALEDVVDGTTPVAKATTADNATKLNGQVASYYATAASVTNIVNGTTTVAKATSAGDSAKLNGQAADYYATATSVTNIVNGTTKVGKAGNADSATSANKVANGLTVVVNGNSTTFDGSATKSITIDAAALGLSKVMNFLGSTTTSISNGSTTATISIGGSNVTVAKGDVVLSGNKEFVWDGSAWSELGDQGSHALKSIKIEGTGYLTGGGTLEANRIIDIASSVKTKIDNGATAYSWGDHAQAGYLKSHQNISGKADKVSGATSGNFAGLDANGNLTDSGKKASDFATSTQGSTADSALQSVKVLGTTLTKSSNELTVAAAKTALGLKSAAYTESSAYATSAQGAKADSAVQSVSIATGTANGKIKLTVDGTATEASVKGLGSAAYTASDAYATAAQGSKADSALQAITTTANGGLKVTNKNQIDIDTNVVFVFNCGSASTLID